MGDVLTDMHAYMGYVCVHNTDAYMRYIGLKRELLCVSWVTYTRAYMVTVSFRATTLTCVRTMYGVCVCVLYMLTWGMCVRTIYAYMGLCVSTMYGVCAFVIYAYMGLCVRTMFYMLTWGYVCVLYMLTWGYVYVLYMLTWGMCVHYACSHGVMFVQYACLHL